MSFEHFHSPSIDHALCRVQTNKFETNHFRFWKVKCLSLPNYGNWNDVCRYVKSRSDNQLRYKSSEGETYNCKPEARTPKTPDNEGDKPIVPCGLIAWSLFNDTYKFTVKNNQLPVNKKNIAWQSDQTKKFGSNVFPKNFQGGGLIGGGKLNESIPVNMPLLLKRLYLFSFLKGINNNLCRVAFTS